MQTATIRLLTWAIVAAAMLAAGTGVLSRGGDGPYEHVTVRGETVLLHGTGLYRHMSAEVAPQGIAQDVVTLVVAIPVLLLALRWSRSGSVRARLLLAGTLAYFLVTYLFYLVMGMYNAMFLVWAVLLATSFFAFAGVMLGFDPATLRERFTARAPARGAGIFLIANAAAIALLWLGIVVPPLLDGTIIPQQAEHYTTLIVQGLDLGLLLPLAVVSGWLLIRRRRLGFLLAPVYLVFLTLLMTALTAKVVAMGLLGYSIIPVVFIIPTLNVIAGVFAVRMLTSAGAAGNTAGDTACNTACDTPSPEQRARTVGVNRVSVGGPAPGRCPRSHDSPS